MHLEMAGRGRDHSTAFCMAWQILACPAAWALCVALSVAASAVVAVPPPAGPATDRSGIDATTIPLQRAGDSLFVPVRIGEGEPEPFLLNFSSDCVEVDRDLVQRTRSELAKGNWGPINNDQFLVRLGTLRIGSIQFGPRLAVVHDLSSWAEDYRGARFHGSLPLAFFAKFDAVVDFQAATMTLVDPSAFHAPPTAIEQPVRLIGGACGVEAKLNGRYTGWYELKPNEMRPFFLSNLFVAYHPELFLLHRLAYLTTGTYGASRFDSFESLGAISRGVVGHWHPVKPTPPADQLSPEFSGSIGGPLLRDLRITFGAGLTRLWIERLSAGPQGHAGAPAAESKDLAGVTALMRAAERGDDEAIESELRSGADVNAADKQGRTPLMLAAASGNPAAVRSILKRRPAIDAADEEGCTALMRAATGEGEEIAKLLLDNHASVDLADKLDRTALMYAARADQGAVVKLLVKSGSDAKRRSKVSTTALSEAVYSGGTSALEALIGEHVSIADGEPLRCAAYFNAVEAIRVLLKNGADANAADAQGITPLMRAARPSRSSPPSVGSSADNAVKFLLSAGANPSAKSTDGETALDIAEDNGAIASANALLAASHPVKRGADGGGATRLIAERAGRGFLLPIIIGGSKVGYMFLDTGAECNFFDAEFAKRQHFQQIKELTGAESTGEFKAAMISVPPMEIGGIPLGPAVAGTGDLSRIRAYAPDARIVAIGTPFGVDDAFTLDYRDGAIEIGAAPARPGAGDRPFRYCRVGTRRLAEARLGDDTLYVGVDTGSPGPLAIFAPYCRQHPELLDVTPAFGLRRGLEGRSARSGLLNDIDFELCGWSTRSALVDLDTGFAAADSQPQVGEDFLQGRSVTFDAKNERGWVNVRPDETVDAAIARLKRGTATDLIGTSPLLRAIDERRDDLAGALLDRGADPNAADKLGRTPLREACGYDSETLVGLLLHHGAKPTADALLAATMRRRLQNALSALLACVDRKSGKPDVDNLLVAAVETNEPVTVRTLLDAGANPNFRGDRGLTALMVSAYYADDAVAELLIGHGAATDARDVDGTSPLNFAVRANKLAVVKVLLSHGAAVDEANKAGCTPLMTAAAHASPEVIESLLHAGADMHQRDSARLTALDYAADARKYANADMLYLAENGQTQ